MSIANCNGTRVAFLSLKPTNQTLRYPVHHQRRWKAFGSALHDGLRRDAQQRERKLTQGRWSSRTSSDTLKNSSWSDREASFPRVHSRTTQGKKDSRREERGRRSEGSRQDFESGTSASSYPLSVPYTTASSEFLYGYNTVYAALRARKRTCYKLYIHSRGASRDEDSKQKVTLRNLARQAKVSIVEGSSLDVRLLDKMSDGRPHNGVILEASPLPIFPLTSLMPQDFNTPSLSTFGIQTKTGKIQRFRHSNPQPTVLFIDSVLDAGNLGAILRTSYFLGMDAVILTPHCAPLNAVALKASAGAAEALNLFRSENPAGLLEDSAKSGWRSVCASTPGDSKSRNVMTFEMSERGVRYSFVEQALRAGEGVDEFLARGPVIIIAGGEGRGLRKFITEKASGFVEILPQDPAAIETVGLDSLNVSVAVAMVSQEVMTRMRVGSGTVLHSRPLEKTQGLQEASSVGVNLDEKGDLGFSTGPSPRVQANINEIEEGPSEVERRNELL
ncbi:uncharacterized protein PV09_07536 [Verruconis gallopava]|uniref:rRNA methyltransferase 1, mitochondrial n=1 Tax=Verruconis gallopava TaxID=253628 RepID=A0A0D2APH3_9PEZI|nr:uncharacterized protein PV09_07536 [Verruconis gallopava]KIW01019.1 hypothetical protein PV09_07536 [Verruconis gallopava]